MKDETIIKAAMGLAIGEKEIYCAACGRRYSHSQQWKRAEGKYGIYYYCPHHGSGLRCGSGFMREVKEGRMNICQK